VSELDEETGNANCQQGDHNDTTAQNAIVYDYLSSKSFRLELMLFNRLSSLVDRDTCIKIVISGHGMNSIRVTMGGTP
jgi:hypothetical protein